jgi:hypothetical protein
VEVEKPKELDPMDDLERLVRELANIIGAEDSARFRTPFQISELYQSILPYRSHRKRLGFDSSDDYDMAVLRLLAGEGGFAAVEPAEVQKQLALEAEAVNPTPGLYREFAAARVTLNGSVLGLVRNAADAYAPPISASEQEVIDETGFGTPMHTLGAEPKRPVFEAVVGGESPGAATEPIGLLDSCGHCSRPLPGHREIVFCPFCGTRLTAALCRRCGSEIEQGWRFCVSCGTDAIDVEA